MSYHAVASPQQLGILPALPFLLPVIVVGGGGYAAYRHYSDAKDEQATQQAAEQAAEDWSLPSPSDPATPSKPLPVPPQPKKQAGMSTGEIVAVGAVAVGILALIGASG